MVERLASTALSDLDTLDRNACTGRLVFAVDYRCQMLFGASVAVTKERTYCASFLKRESLFRSLDLAYSDEEMCTSHVCSSPKCPEGNKLGKHITSRYSCLLLSGISFTFNILYCSMSAVMECCWSNERIVYD